MKKTLLIMAVVLAFSSCIQTETRVKVKKDGSGTIEKTVLMRSDVVEMLASMQAFDPTKKGMGVMDEVQLKADEEKLGEGVTYKGATPLKNSKGEGYKVLYTFTDVNRIRVSQTPGDELPSADMGGGEKSGSGEFLTFNFKKGGTSDLRVRLYQMEKTPARTEAETPDKEEENAEKENEQMDPGMLEQVYRDMKFSIFVEVEGTVVETNADHRNGSVVSLVNVDFNKLMEKPEALENLTSNKVKTLEDMKAFTQTFPGIELETKDEVLIRFR